MQVSELVIYPVKSMAPISLQCASLDHFGFKHDRRWMVVDSNYKFMTQRQQARMSLIHVRLMDHGLVLQAPHMTEITVVIPAVEACTKVTIWKDQCNVADCGDAVAHWLSRFLNVKSRLMYFPDNEVRQVDLNYAQQGDRIAFSDGFPVLLLSQASLDDLNHRLDTPISIARFRPNLVVRGCKPFAEDGWHRIRIGELTFRVVKPCSRCVIPNIDLHTAERGQEPTRTLISYRRRDGKIYFGQNVIADSQGDIAVGMTVEILS
ncbi:MAG: MOSC domain-containing protein [Gammaproteobacteria bacterium]|nr:MOSC domain-containing protein [Gammaproteobacteria bacterium]